MRDAVQVEPVTPLALKGKAEPVPAHRLVAVEALAAGRARRQGAPMVGRDADLAALAAAFDHLTADGSAVLTLVVGMDVGKSRLATEFLAGIDALVLSGRCPSYGEGITYGPLGGGGQAGRGHHRPGLAIGCAAQDRPPRAS
ncbi:MAG: hypothetical protein ACT4PO_16375 [Actinomycetota bacterium]